MPITIRPANEADLGALDAIFPRVEGRHKQRFAIQANGRGLYLTAWDNDDLVGIALLKWRGMPELHTTLLAPSPRVTDLYVHEDWRGQGIGNAILHEAEHQAKLRGYSTINLSVALDNPAKRLYERRGYQDIGIPTYVLRWLKVYPDRRQESITEEVIVLVKTL